MVKAPNRGEVWLIDLGMAAKVRPCLVISIPLEDEDRAIVAIVPHTTSVRGTRFEVNVDAKFLRSGAFDTQNIVTIPRTKLIRPLGMLDSDQLAHIADSIREWLGL